MPATLPEIREADAPPDIAALYGDIKAAADLPQVNLIFRHLATRPGMLAWVWQTLRPLYVSQELADAASGLSQSVPRTDASPIPGHLAPEDIEPCRAVLTAYNSGNPQNLIALTAFVHLLDGATPRPSRTLTPRRAQPAATGGGSFPPIPRREDLPAEVTRLLARLAARHRTVAGVIPSLYVHLGLWPAILPAVDEFLGQRLEEAGWHTQVQAIIDRASATASDLAANLQPVSPPPMDDDDRVAMAATIRTFVNATIPEMVVVGRWLAWPERTM